MKYIFLIFGSSALLATSACSSDIADSPGTKNGKPGYVSVDENLSQVRADFNANTEKIRLVFIIGPSCGICLRGMADLDKSLIKHIQNDPRVHTFAIHVPTLGAEEKHVAAAIPLLDGPRVTHYWDASGHTGLQFQESLAMDIYAWDIWMLYDPGTLWKEGLPPPPPAYMEHQLPSLPRNLKLDADRFASEVMQRLPAELVKSDPSPLMQREQDEPAIIPVAQPRGVMIQHNHESRGGYRNIKKIEALRFEGITEIDDQEYALSVEARRPNTYLRTVDDGAHASTLSWDGSTVTREGTPHGLPDVIQDEILSSYEFDGWMTDWKAKGHQVNRLGMRKYGDQLPWLLEAKLGNGKTWYVFVDSHSGDVFRTALMDSSGGESIAIEYSDFSDVDGFRLPHRVDYFECDQLLMSDRFSNIVVEMSRADDKDGSIRNHDQTP
jgi:hypothetical protein